MCASLTMPMKERGSLPRAMVWGRNQWERRNRTVLRIETHTHTEWDGWTGGHTPHRDGQRYWGPSVNVNDQITAAMEEETDHKHTDRFWEWQPPQNTEVNPLNDNSVSLLNLAWLTGYYQILQYPIMDIVILNHDIWIICHCISR